MTPPALRPLAPDERVAIAIPTKNRPTYLAALLASLLEQTFARWLLVINDSSDVPIERDEWVRPLLARIRAAGHQIRMVRTNSGWDRHQRALEVVPEDVELVLRVDDDVALTPRFLEQVQKPFRFFGDRPIAAVGGSVPEEHLPALDLDLQLTERNWVPTIEEPTWRLQGNHYTQREVLEVESLLGHAICYRRSALTAVGGWAVRGYSDHAYREETDACMRLRTAGYVLLVTTEALAWHLYAPAGGSRTIAKTDAGIVVTSDRSVLRMDEVVFRLRLAEWKQQGLTDQSLSRYRLADLEAGRCVPRPMVGLIGRLKALRRKARRALGAIARAVTGRGGGGRISR